MTIRFSCPQCQKTLTAPDDKAGMRVACPGCKHPLVIPKFVPPPPLPLAPAPATADDLHAARTDQPQKTSPLEPVTRLWRQLGTPAKFGIAGGGLLCVFVMCCGGSVFVGSRFVGSRDSRSTSSDGDGAKSPKTNQYTRLDLVNKLVVKAGGREVKTLEAKFDRFGGGVMDDENLARCGASKYKDGKVLVHNALGGRYDYEWWVRNIGPVGVEDFYDPTDREFLNQHDGDFRSGKWTYQCRDGNITFIGEIVVGRFVTLRRFGLF